MKQIMGLVAVLVVSCGLAGCFQVDQVVTLSPDGSGTVEETFMISRKVAESMAALTGGMGEPERADGDGKPAKKEQSFFKDDEIKKRGEGFGPDVHFVRMERLANKQFEGYRAVYSFRDINKLRLDHGSPGMPGQTGKGGESAPKGTEFAFTPGTTARLVVKQPKKSVPSAGEAPVMSPPPARETSAEELAMVRQMFDGLRISTTLVIKGTVIDTNATHRAGSTIILTEIDFGKILDKPELLAGMTAIQPNDQAAAMEMIKKLPGMKVDMNDELRVGFR